MNLREFGNFAIEQGQLANPAPNYKYKGQCVSLVQQYLYLVLGIPFKAHGNAKDWANNVPDGFDKLSTNAPIQRGDILVYGSNYGGGYGHIGIIDVNNNFLDQNGVKPLHVGYKNTPFQGYICILRSRSRIDMGDNIEQGTFTVKVDKSEANVRTEPNVNSKIVAQPGGYDYLVKGDTFKAVEIVDGENINGNNKWYKSQKGNYVWSGGLTKL